MLLNIFKCLKAIVVIITLVQIDTRLLVLTCFILATIIRIIRYLHVFVFLSEKVIASFEKTGEQGNLAKRLLERGW
jgi:hypothetical protein